MDLGSILFGIQTLVPWISRLLGSKKETTGSGNIDFTGVKIETGIKIEKLNLILNILSQIGNPQISNFETDNRFNKEFEQPVPAQNTEPPYLHQTQRPLLSGNHFSSANFPGSPGAHASPFTMGLYFRVDCLDWVSADHPFRIAEGHLFVPVTLRIAKVDFCEISVRKRKVVVHFTDGEPDWLQPEWCPQEDPATSGWPLPNGANVQVGGSDWRIRPVALDHPVLLEEKAASLISFSTDIAQAVWCLERTHSGRSPEKYWFIVSSQAT